MTRLDAPRPAGPLAVLAEIGWVFLRLGCLSFGGPIAHLGYFREEFVERRRWVDDAHYADVVALCQFLPGPASSQVVFALGMQRAGLAGALVASLCFTAPSALLMLGFAYGVDGEGELARAGWLHGLKLAAVAVVAQAVWGMGRRLCPDRPRASLCLLAAGLLLAAPSAWTQVGVIAAGGLFGWALLRGAGATAGAGATVASSAPRTSSRWLAGAALLAFGALLALLPLLATTTGQREVAVFDAFYRSGALVFGGGHVVLPLLRAEVVPHWLTDGQFLAGYGAAQALPGPLFAFAAYLGAAMTPGSPSLSNGLLCLFAIFLPAWLLVGGALPFWTRLRAHRATRAALAGANAAVVGVLLAALYDPLIRESVLGRADAVAALLGFGLLEHWRTPPWLVVLGMAAAGHFLLGA